MHSLFAGDCPDDNQLNLYQQRRLSAEEYERVERHVVGCDICTEILVHLAHVLAPAPSSPLTPVGQQVGRFLVEGPLGKGGMGSLFVAYDTQLHRRIALKMVRQDVSHVAQQSQLKKRLIREARALASFAHPHILPVYEIGEWEEQVFVAMQLVDGVDLRQWLHREGPSWLAVTQLFVQAARGLMAAHKAGIVHRDIKPDNFLVTQDGHVYLADFGLVVNGASYELSSTHAESDELRRLTQTGTLVGTPGYIAPEMYNGQAASPKTDQFALCVSLFESLFHQKPHVLEPFPDHIRAIARGEFLLPPTSDVPASLCDVLFVGMAPAPEDRFIDVQGWIDAIEGCLIHQASAPTLPERPAFVAEVSEPEVEKEEKRPWLVLLGGSVLGLCLAVIAVLVAFRFASVPGRVANQRTTKARASMTGVKRAVTLQPRVQPKRGIDSAPAFRKSRRIHVRSARRSVSARRTRARRVLRPRRARRGVPRRRAALVGCAAVRARYRQRNRRGWEAFADESGRLLWRQYADCHLQQGRCQRGVSLYREYGSLLAKRRRDGDFFAYEQASRQCRLVPLLSIAAPLRALVVRITPYYSRGVGFCQRAIPIVLRRHFRSARRLSWAQRERWEALMKAGLKCVALPLKKYPLTARVKARTCALLRRSHSWFQRSRGKAVWSAEAFVARYPKCRS